MASDRSRAGRYVRQQTGYPAFIPAPLPPDPPIALAGGLQALLSRADQSVGRLDGVIMSPKGPFGWAAVAADVTSRHRRGHRQLVRLRGRSMQISTRAPV